MGTLAVATNPRYFSVDGKTTLFIGPHNWYTIQDSTDVNTVANPFDFTKYLNQCKGNGANFLRLWMWESPRAMPLESDTYTFSPLPWARTGPGNAADGSLKFDLTTWDSTYFTRLYDRVGQAIAAGFVVGVQLFEGWSVGTLGGTQNPGTYHPFKSGNNINSISVDANADGNLYEMHAQTAGAILDLQQAYVRHVLDTLNGYDEIIYEVANETQHDTATLNWQAAMADYIASYESLLAKQHPVWLTATISESGPNTWLTGANSNVKAISLHDIAGNYTDNMPVADGGKISLLDTDHIFGEGGDYLWMWKAFMRGHNPLWMDGIDNAFSTSGTALRAKLQCGAIRRMSTKINLDTVVPDGTAYMLSGAGEWLILSPTGASLSVAITPGVYAYEWLMLDSHEIVEKGSIIATGTTTFFPPRAVPCVLLVQSAVGAGSSIPQNAVLDNFNAADGSLGSIWTVGADPTALAPRILSNQCAANVSGGYSDAFINTATFGPDCEVFCTIGVAGSGETDLTLRVTNEGTMSASGYLCYISDVDGSVALYDWHGGNVYDEITSVAHDVAIGSVYCFRAVGNTLTVYKDGVSVLTTTSSAHTGAGRIGIGINGSTSRIDNFGGGTVTTVTQPTVLDRGGHSRRIR